jgi:DNA-binding SARP family transcriptional activator/TolB-like protein
MLRLVTFGGLRVENGVVVNGAANPRSRLALLAVLAAAGTGGVRREKLMAMFWPDSDDERARNALRQALFVLRRDLGGSRITQGVADLRLDPDVITSDVGDFDQAVKGGRWEDAVGCYQGPFLDGVIVREAPEFERWADEQRQRLANAYARALEALAVVAEAHRERAAAVRWWERRAALDPLSTRVAMAYMKALTEAGERERAIQHAAVYAAVMRSELESGPDPAVVAFADALRNGTGGHATITADVAGNGVTGSAPLKEVVTSSVRAASAPPDPGCRADVGLPVTRSTGVAEREVAGVGPVPPAAPRRWWSRRGVIGAWAVLLGLSSIAYARPWAAKEPDVAALDSHRVVVADFENLTGDTAFNRLGVALADWVTHGVLQTGVARVVDPASLVAVRRLNPEVDALAGRERIVAMARAAAAGTVISGAVYREGDGLVIRARITDLVNDRVLTTLDPVPAPTNDPLQRADLLRDKVAGALASAFDARIAAITLPSSRPPTFAAYREYILGLEQFTLNEDAAIPHLERASQLDTTFGLPLIWAAFVYGNGERTQEKDSVVAILASRRAFLGPLEELQLQAFQAKDADERLLLAERGARLSPGSTWSQNAGVELHDRNQMREAIRHFEEIDPEHGWVREWPIYWLYYTRALHAIGQYDKELQAVWRAARLTQGASVRFLEIRALLSLGHLKEAGRRVNDLLSTATVDCASANVLDAVAQEFRAHGHAADADSVVARWVRLCRDEAARRPAPPASADSMEYLARRQFSLGLALYRDGAFAEAEPELQWAARQPQQVSIRAHEFLARIAARRGDRAAAEGELRARQRDPSLAGTAEADAAVETLLGQKDRAVDLLTAGRDRLHYFWLHRDPDYDSLRDHPGFIALATPK